MEFFTEATSEWGKELLKGKHRFLAIAVSCHCRRPGFIHLTTDFFFTVEQTEHFKDGDQFCCSCSWNSTQDVCKCSEKLYVSQSEQPTWWSQVFFLLFDNRNKWHSFISQKHTEDVAVHGCNVFSYCCDELWRLSKIITLIGSWQCIA